MYTIMCLLGNGHICWPIFIYIYSTPQFQKANYVMNCGIYSDICIICSKGTVFFLGNVGYTIYVYIVCIPPQWKKDTAGLSAVCLRVCETDRWRGGGRECRNHVLLNYIDTKAKCRHLKNWPVKGLFYQSLMTRDTISHDGILDPALCELLPLSPFLWFKPPPFPLQVNFLDDDILYCFLWVLPFYGRNWLVGEQMF